MSYAVLEAQLDDIEAGRVPAVRLEPGQTGLALRVRHGDAWVGFAMRDASAGAGAIDPAELIDDEIRVAATSEDLRRQLAVEGPAPTVTVAICTKDRPDWVARLLGSLAPLRAETPFDILVIDNAPSDSRTRDAVEAVPGVRYVMEPKAGLDFGRNAALANATGEVLAFLDDDVTVDRHWMKGLLRAWSTNPEAGAVTGLVLPMFLETEAQILFEKRGGFRRGFRPLRYGSTLQGDNLHPCGAGKFGAGANMSVRVELMRRLGGFDEALDTGRPLPGGGDLDMFYRVIRSGATLVYEPQMAVFHEHRRDLSVLRRQYYTWGLGYAAFAVKSMRTDPAMRRAHVSTIAWSYRYLAAMLVTSLLGREPVSPRMVIGEIWGLTKGLAGEYDRSQRRVQRIREAVQ